MFQKARAPHYLFQDIWKWAQKATDTKVEFSGAGTCASVIIELNCHYDLDDTKPTTISVTLPTSGEIVHITTHDFLAQLRSLLSDPVLTRKENLLFGDDGNPFIEPVALNGSSFIIRDIKMDPFIALPTSVM